jgi:hypothetical protein
VQRPWPSSPRGCSAQRIAVLLSVAAAIWAISPSLLRAAIHRTENFDVSAGSGATAQLIARQAEDLRSTLSQEWLGEKLPSWPQRCVVKVNTGVDRLSGDTTYTIVHGRVTRWQMVLNGPLERIVETLLPHEVLHTILASHFRNAVPRWADEGAALSVEAEADRRRLWAQEGPRLTKGPWQPLQEMFMTDTYPADRGNLRAFYAQGAVVTEFLLAGGKARFLEFVQAGIRDGWDRSAAACYGFADVESLESAWIDWLRNDRPAVAVDDHETLADALSRQGSGQNLAAVGMDSTDVPRAEVSTASGSERRNRYGNP